VPLIEEVVGRKVLAMLGDHNAAANYSVMVFLLELEQPYPPRLGRRREGRPTDDPLLIAA
jgi:hypothetical protein